MKWSSVWNSAYSLAVFTAILGFIAAVITQRFQDRRSPRKGISWDVTIERPASLKKDDHNRIGISYNGRPVADLVQVRVLIENTGNTVVKNEYLRFELPSQATLLEMSPDPTPEPELGVEEVDEPPFSRPLRPIDSQPDRIYRIGHFEAGQIVSFLIVTDGGAWNTWDDIHPYNEDGGVPFQQRDIARAREDAEEVLPFIRMVTAFLLLAILVSITPTPASYVLSGVALFPLVRIIIAAPRILRVVQQLLKLLSKNLYTVTVADSQGIQIGDTNRQDNRWRPDS